VILKLNMEFPADGESLINVKSVCDSRAFRVLLGCVTFCGIFHGAAKLCFRGPGQPAYAQIHGNSHKHQSTRGKHQNDVQDSNCHGFYSIADNSTKIDAGIDAIDRTKVCARPR